MSVKTIKEWLAEYKTLSVSEIHTYANTLRHNDELVTSLYEVLEQRPGVDILDPICHQLFEFFRSKELELQRFTFEFIPTLTWLYLSMVTSNEKKNCSGLEAFFLGIYNLEIVYPDGSPKIKTYRVPSLAQPSVYHEPVNLSTLALTESALARYEKTEAETWRGNRHPQYETIHGQNRQEILTYVMQCYNADIASMSPQSHQSLCDTCQRIATNGFNRSRAQGMDKADGSMLSNCTKSSDSFTNCNVDPRHEPRIPVSSPLLIEMLIGVYFTMFNGQSKLAVKAVEEIHYRATYELYADVLLVTNAVRNCLKYSPSGQPDTAMGIGIALSPTAASSSTVSKSAITNASFRATKLPDDISVPNEETDSKPLPTIDEDADSPGEKTGNKPVLRLPKVRKSDKKEKEKEKEKEKKRVNVEADPVSTGSSWTQPDAINDKPITIMKNWERSAVDNIEMSDRSPKMPHISTSVDDCIMSAASQEEKAHSGSKCKIPSSNSLGKDMKLA
ncbi:hyccin-like [Argonauta hians]